MNRDFKNILIVRTDRMGDVVLTTPSLAALRKAYPSSRISLLVAAATKDLISDNPNVDEILVDDRTGEHKGFFGFLKMVQILQAHKFDLAIIFHTKKRYNSLCFLAGIPNRLGYKNNKFGFLLNRPVNDTRHFGEKHEAQYCVDLLQAIGIESVDLDISVSVLEDSEQWVDQFFAQNGIGSQDKFVAIHPGASDPDRCWPEQRFAELIDKIAEKYKNSKIVLVGGADIRPIARKIRSLTAIPLFDLTGMTTLSQLVSLLKRCSLLVSNDSGPVHVAAALKTPVISIFTRNLPGVNPARWHPLCEQSRVVAVPFDTDISFQKSQSEEPEYLDLVFFQEVLEAVDALFKLC